VSNDHLGPAAAQVLLKGMDPESRESGLRLDRHGVWHHENVPVTHERLARALSTWLDHHPDDPDSDRFVLRPSPEFWAWVDVEDAPFQATLSELTDEGGLCLTLSDGSEEIYDGPSIAVGADDAWYVTVRDGSFEARLGRGAMIHLADYLEEDDSADQGVALHLPGGRHLLFTERRCSPQK
jgi:hypothetical protein